jgi:hypothetical protein
MSTFAMQVQRNLELSQLLGSGFATTEKVTHDEVGLREITCAHFSMPR